MEYIEGKNLKDMQNKPGLSVEDATRFTLQLLEIVGCLHSLSIVHRDIKPDNIMNRDGRLLLIDYGQAFVPGDREFETSLTARPGNAFLRLPEFDAREEEDKDKENEPRDAAVESRRSVISDVTFCIGMFYFFLTGKYPRTLKAKLTDLDQRVIPIFTKGFQTEVSMRFHSVQDAIKELRQFVALDGEKSEAGENKMDVTEEPTGQKEKQMIETEGKPMGESEEIVHETASKVINLVQSWPPEDQQKLLALISSGVANSVNRK